MKLNSIDHDLFDTIENGAKVEITIPKYYD